MVFILFKWWYGEGWVKTFGAISTRTLAVSRSFSVPILLRTLFEPWRRNIVYPGKSLDAKIRAALDNLISRLVGFVVRMFVLITAGLMILFTVIYSLMLAIIWPFLPITILYLIYRGATT